MNYGIHKSICIVFIPHLGKLRVLNGGAKNIFFCVFLDEPHQNPCGPFFAMEVEKLRSTFVLEIIHFHVLVLSGDSEEDELHPRVGKHLDFLRDIVVNCFIENLQGKIDDLRISNIVLDSIENFRKDCIQKLAIVVALFLDYTELKVCANSENTMEHRRDVLVSLQLLHNLLHGNPILVFETDHIAQDFPIQFDQHVFLGTTDDGCDQWVTDGEFLLTT